MDTISGSYTVQQCSKCLGDTEYYCTSCSCNLCLLCKKSHVQDLKTIDHNVITHRNKFHYIPTREICQIHFNIFFEMFCTPCELPVCYHCLEHRTHWWMDIQRAYQRKRQQHRGTIYTIRSDALFYRPVLLTRNISDIKTCRTKFYTYQSQM